MTRDPADERAHDLRAVRDPGGAGPGVSEMWSFDFASADGSLGGWVRVTRFGGHSWFHAMLAGPRRQLLAVIDHDVPHRSSPLEVRTTGLWADHICETPYDHWTLGLEAFALGVDDPLELYGRQLGDRVPLGFDLEWETDGPVLDGRAEPGVTGYGVACRVHGEILVGADVIDLDAVGFRDHAWGSIAWDGDGWQLGAALDGGVHCLVDVGGGTSTLTMAMPDGAIRTEPAEVTLALDDDGLPTGAGCTSASAAIDVEVLAVTPLSVPVPGRSEVRRPRAMCRVRTASGDLGVGWLEVRGARGLLGPSSSGAIS